MSHFSREQILEKSKQLANMIASTPEVEIFQQAECKMKKNEEVTRLMNKLKKLQQQAVNLKHVEKEGALQKTEEEIEETYTQLREIPIVNEFQESQQQVNALLQLVSSTISTFVTDEVVRQTGGDLLRGKSGTKNGHNQG